MKLSSASKKVLASALSAAMVVAFAPVTAFAATSAAETEAAAIAAGYTVKLVTTSGAFSSTGAGTYYYKTLADAAGAAEWAGVAAGSITLLADQDVDAAVNFNQGAVAIDLNGYKISNSASNGHAIYSSADYGITLNGVKEGSEIVNTASSNADAVAANVYGVKGGTYGKVTGAITSIEGGTFNGAVDSSTTSKLTIKGGTFNKGIMAGSANAVDFKGEVKVANAGDKDETGKTATDIYGVYADDAAITIAAGAKVDVTSATTLGTAAKKVAVVANQADAYGIVADSLHVAINAADKTVGALTVTATAAGRDQAAVGILADAGAVTTEANADKGLFSTIKVDAETSGVAVNVGDATYNNATAVQAVGAGIYGTESALNASVKDDGANAYALNGTSGKVYTAGGSYKTNAGEKKGYAVSVGSSVYFETVGGTYEGIINVTSGYTDIKGGTFSTKVTPAKDYQCIDNGTAYVVSLKKATVASASVSGAIYDTGTYAEENTANAQLVQDAAQSVVDALTEGATSVQGFAFAEGKDASALVKDFAKYSPTAEAKIAAISKRTATDAENAAIAAFDKYAADNLSKIRTDSYSSVSIKLKSGDSANTVLGTITDLGSTRGIANALTVQLKGVRNGAATILAFDGTTVTELAYTKKDVDTVKLPANAVALAVMTIDDEALKDAVNNQPQTPAVEKATQGIDVSKKSRTVKIGSKTKTAKALYFKMGASAETKLATAKKSGSSRITVSGDKVTLKKGTKKGTYTAKVSLKAAGSDEYLAAAKTITVKFVVKK